MTMQQISSNELTLAHVLIKVDGSPVSAEVNSAIISVVVELNLYLPAMFIIRLHNPHLQWPGADKFKIGKEVSIGMDYQRNIAGQLVIGEITSLELDADPKGTPTMTVRGFDKLHRLQRGRKTRSFLQMSDGDLITKLAGEAGLSGEAASTGTVFPYILQNNETNLEFLQRRARRAGMELVVADNKLKLRPKAPQTIEPLTWGTTLTHFMARQTAMHETKKVIVYGWDPKKKSIISGQANTKGETSFNTTGDVTTAYEALSDGGDASKVAQAIMEDLDGRALQVEGVCLGNNKIVPGKQVKVDGAGAEFSKTYYVTTVKHRYSQAEGYNTIFEANGRQANSLLELTGETYHPQPVPGPLIGIVTNLNDPENMGRVKVKFPTLPPPGPGAEIESDWARIASPMAGKGRGFFFLPEINDEVVVYFENGDINRPIVLGALWNGQEKPPKGNSEVVEGGAVKERLLKSTSGHVISIDDSQGSPKISIIDKSTKNKVVIDTTSKKITIETDTGGSIELKATGGKVTIEANDVEIKGQTSTKVDSAQVQIKASAAAELSGATLDLKGSSQASLSGGIVKIN